MTSEEAVAIIRKEYLCVDRDCDIERSCGKCDLVMPSKEPILEAYKMAIKALEQEPCEDAISRQEVLSCYQAIRDMGDLGKVKDVVLVDNIKMLPSVQPKAKMGKWIPIYGNVKCSVCGNVKDGRSVGKATHYCDFCGAKMESEG